MDFEDNIEELEKGVSFEQDKEEEGFGLNERELKELEYTADAVIFAIDCRASMLERNEFNEDGLSNFATVIKAASGFLKSKIVSSESDQTGIVLYNCDQTQNTNGFEGVYILDKLDRPNAETIKSLETLIDTKDLRFKANEQEQPLSELLWTCQQQFKSLGMDSFSKRIFLFTNEENPMPDRVRAQEETIERAKDLLGENTEIELFPMSYPRQENGEFDVKIFYSNFIYVDDSDLESAYMRIQDLSKRIRLKEFKKRVLGKCMFSVTGKMNVGLKFFNLTKTTKKPSAKFINKNSGKELKSIVRYTCNETNETLYRTQIGTHFPLKNKKVVITEKDMKKIKHFEDPGMRLIGFKSKKSIKIYQNIRPSYFIYPDEKVMKGSSKVFHSMINSLIKKDKVAYVRFVPREGAMVRFCYLLPQAESGQEGNGEGFGNYTPPGFHLIFIPYSEDVRDMEDHLAHKESLPKPTKSENRTAKLFVENMSIDFNSRSFENPSIQKFYSGLQSMALNEEEPEQIQDTLEPDYEGQANMKEIIDKVKDTFKLDEVSRETTTKIKTNKRKLDEDSPRRMKVEEESQKSNGSRRGRRAKKEEKKDSEKLVTAISDKKLKELINGGDLIDFPAKKLKELCMTRDIQIKSNSSKRVLISCLQKYVDKI